MSNSLNDNCSCSISGLCGLSNCSAYITECICQTSENCELKRVTLTLSKLYHSSQKNPFIFWFVNGGVLNIPVHWVCLFMLVTTSVLRCYTSAVHSSRLSSLHFSVILYAQLNRLREAYDYMCLFLSHFWPKQELSMYKNYFLNIFIVSWTMGLRYKSFPIAYWKCFILYRNICLD